MSAKLPGFKKWWPRCLNLDTATASQSQTTCKAVSNACLHLSHLGLSTSPSLSRCSFKWQCSVSNPIIILSWFLLKLSNSPALLAEGHLRNPLAYLCPWMDCQYSSLFQLVQPLITPIATFADIPRAGSGPISGYKEPCLGNWSAVSLSSTPVCPGLAPMLDPVMFSQFYQGLMTVPE
jgi:hypothetical protein